MKDLKIKVTADDIEACHGLKSKDTTAPKRTIVRFVNRKFCNIVLSKRKLLKTKKLTRSDLTVIVSTLMKICVPTVIASGSGVELSTNME